MDKYQCERTMMDRQKQLDEAVAQMEKHLPSDFDPRKFSWFGKVMCFLGQHDWDGHADEDYPPPRCWRCGRWNWRKRSETH